MNRHRWRRSDPNARTDQLTAVPTRIPPASTTPPAPRPGVSAAASTAPAHSDPAGRRRPRTLRIPRVRKVILRDHIDITAADQLEALLRGGGLLDAAVVISEAVIGRQVIPAATWDRVVRAGAHALIQAEERLTPAERRTSAALASSNAQCPRCTAAELCGSHQQVLWRWWDLRDAAAVGVVNAVVAARAIPPTARPTPEPTPRRIPSRRGSQS